MGEHWGRRGAPGVRRVALLSVHTCPLDQPGTGDSGGMNVYVRSVARRLASMGVGVDVFTRWAGRVDPSCGVPDAEAPSGPVEMDPGVRVIHLEAGPPEPLPKEDLQRHLCEFLYALLRFEAAEAARVGEPRAYDVVHSHYWLSGWVGRLAAERWGVPLVQTFHTLGRVKNLTLADGDGPEPPARIGAEERIVATADRILVSTPDEATELVRLYGARPDAVRVVSPGVDTAVFRPGPREAIRDALGIDDRPLILFAGRLQALKGPDVAVRALAELRRADPDLDPMLVIFGGPSGNACLGPDALAKLAADLGVSDRVVVREPVRHRLLADWYRAADVVVVPSRSESFGLVALEASACGTPVVASDVGGLRTAVRNGVTGMLVPLGPPSGYARALGELLRHTELAREMGEAGARHARRFDWTRAAEGLLAVYGERVATTAARAGRA